MKVYVYYNLHKHVWSIKALEGPQKGKIVAYRDEVWLKDALPVVSASGRERVRRASGRCSKACRNTRTLYQKEAIKLFTM